MCKGEVGSLENTRDAQLSLEERQSRARWLAGMTHVPQGSQKGTSWKKGRPLSYEMRVGITVMWLKMYSHGEWKGRSTVFHV